MVAPLPLTAQTLTAPLPDRRDLGEESDLMRLFF